MPRFSHVRGVAFDVERRRLIVATVGGIGYMYAYSTEKDRWSLLRDMNNVDLRALCYSADDDVLYGLCSEHRGGFVLCQYHPEGAVLKKVTLDAVQPGREGPFENVQLGVAGEYLVLIVPSGDSPGGEPATVYVVDPSSGEALLACKQLEPQPFDQQQRSLEEEIARAAEPRKGRLAPMPETDSQPRARPATEEQLLVKPILNPASGHYYELVRGRGVTWEQAKAAAEARSYKAMQGYLATVTSKQEEAFLKLQWGDCGAWIGGTDAEEEGVWKWVTGPEAGQVFWRGGPQGKAVGYHNWLRSGGFGPEPNNSRGGQHYLVFGALGGCWDDESGDRGKGRLIVEYSSE